MSELVRNTDKLEDDNPSGASCQLPLHKGAICQLKHNAMEELEAKLEDYYQKWAYLTPEVVMKIIHGEDV